MILEVAAKIIKFYLISKCFPEFYFDPHISFSLRTKYKIISTAYPI